jgi:hypothetical protein
LKMLKKLYYSKWVHFVLKVSGTSMEMHDGMKIRGDINIALIVMNLELGGSRSCKILTSKAYSSHISKRSLHHW